MNFSADSPVRAIRSLSDDDLADSLHHLGLSTLGQVMALLLNTSSLELLTRRDIQLDRELKVTGMANLVSGLAGGLIGSMLGAITGPAVARGLSRLGLNRVVDLLFHLPLRYADRRTLTRKLNAWEPGRARRGGRVGV